MSVSVSSTPSAPPSVTHTCVRSILRSGPSHGRHSSVVDTVQTATDTTCIFEQCTFTNYYNTSGKYQSFFFFFHIKDLVNTNITQIKNKFGYDRPHLPANQSLNPKIIQKISKVINHELMINLTVCSIADV